jgi:hypothetical protein
VLQISPVTAAAREFFSAVQDDNIFPAIDGNQFFDPANVHDHRAVDADEVSGI